MRRFWEERYCAGLMRLVVVGPQPLRELEALVRTRFGAVRNLGAAVPAFPSAPHYRLARARKYLEACIFQICCVRRRCGDARGGGARAARGPRAPRPQAGHPVERAPRAARLAQRPLRPAEPPAGVRGQDMMQCLAGYRVSAAQAHLAQQPLRPGEPPAGVRGQQVTRSLVLIGEAHMVGCRGRLVVYFASRLLWAGVPLLA